MSETEELTPRMRALAGAGHARGAELRELADKLDEAAAGYFADPQTVDVRRFLGNYARARRVWCECSGEPLVSQAAMDAGAALLSALLPRKDSPDGG